MTSQKKQDILNRLLEKGKAEALDHNRAMSRLKESLDSDEIEVNEFIDLNSADDLLLSLV